MTFLLYILFIIGITSATFVLKSNNMVYSALSLIIVFLSSALILLILKADFLGYLFIIVYVGAVSILFLFVIMNLNIKEDEFQQTFIKYNKYKYFDIILFLLLLSTLFFISFQIFTNPVLSPNFNSNLNFIIKNEILWWYANTVQNNSINAISSTLYTYNSIYLIISGLMLLTAMVGAIALTLEKTETTKKQDAQEQIFRKVKKSVILYKLKK